MKIIVVHFNNLHTYYKYTYVHNYVHMHAHIYICKMNITIQVSKSLQQIFISCIKNLFALNRIVEEKKRIKKKENYVLLKTVIH